MAAASAACIAADRFSPPLAWVVHHQAGTQKNFHMLDGRISTKNAEFTWPMLNTFKFAYY